MNEDLSATIRTGVTVVIVAALVSTVLSLMVVAQTILSAGQGTLQAGTDRIGQQQYEIYNGGTQFGTDVRAAISLYASQDMAILVHTSTMNEDEYFNYNALMADDPSNPLATTPKAPSETTPYTVFSVDIDTVTDNLAGGNPYYIGALLSVNGLSQFNGDSKVSTAKGVTGYILDSARFDSRLIRDQNELIIGIAFTQR